MMLVTLCEIAETLKIYNTRSQYVMLFKSLRSAATSGQESASTA